MNRAGKEKSMKMGLSFTSDADTELFFSVVDDCLYNVIDGVTSFTVGIVSKDGENIITLFGAAYA